MNEFDHRWQNCVARARLAEVPPVEAPFGFSSRVLAGLQVEAASTSVAAIWECLGLRALAGVTALLLVVAALEYGEGHGDRLTFPHVEHDVARVFWML